MDGLIPELLSLSLCTVPLFVEVQNFRKQRQPLSATC